MEHLTLGGVITLVLALAGAVSTIGSAVEKITKATKAVRAPEQRQNDEIAEIKERLDKLESRQKKDESQIEVSKECNRVLTKGMLALLEHGINGNNIDQMRDAKNDVEAYLINH